MDILKLKFLTADSLELLGELESNSVARWGVMNVHEMIEHLADFYNISSAKIECKLFTSEEHLPAYRTFLLSDKAFRENTKAPTELLGDVPRPLRFSSLDEAKEDLDKAVDNFVEYFKEDAAKKTLHPVFSMLNFEEWILLHYKHVQHHLKQFDLLKAG